LDSFASAIFILSGAFLSVAAIGNLTLYLKRNRMKQSQSQSQSQSQNQEEDLLSDEMDISVPSFVVNEMEEKK
jgi:hypothetical protein